SFILEHFFGLLTRQCGLEPWLCHSLPTVGLAFSILVFLVGTHFIGIGCLRRVLSRRWLR
ncbi:hypothetical protein PanWU01x14_267300, partial [Parasponia andersonii]